MRNISLSILKDLCRQTKHKVSKHVQTAKLSCRFSAGRIPRHSALSNVVRRGPSAAGIPSMLEQSGLDRGDGKRPDRITVYRYSRGRCLVWDATCVDTFASSNLIRATLAAGSVADAADVSKIAKYAELGRRFIFQPVAVETSGAMGKSTIQFFKDLGRRLAVRFTDQRERDFLFHRVSLAILRGNTFSILQSYRDLMLTYSKRLPSKNLCSLYYHYDQYFLF